MLSPVGNNNNEVSSSSDQPNPAVQPRIQFASAKLLGDRDVVLAAVQQRSSSDDFPSLKDQAGDDSDVQTVAFRYHPKTKTLEYYDSQDRELEEQTGINGDRLFVLGAAAETAPADNNEDLYPSVYLSDQEDPADQEPTLQYASERLRGDIEVVRAAIRYNGNLDISGNEQ